MLLYFFLALPCASLTTISAISDSRAFLKFLFFTLEAPNLNRFGMLSIPLLISLLPNSEPKAFDPKSSPVFNRSVPIPLPVWFTLSYIGASLFIIASPFFSYFLKCWPSQVKLNSSVISSRSNCPVFCHFYIYGKLFSTYSFPFWCKRPAI